MCIAPITLPDGQASACHKCWQCAEHRVLDWEGRCIAEGATSVAAYAVTLTYGRNSMGEKLHERALVMTYSDVQKYLKLLRRHRYTVRYFVAGEFGAMKGRVHWHIILFFGPRAPLIKRGRIVEGADMSPVPPIAGVHQHGHWVADALSRGEECVRFNHQRVDENGEPVFIWKDGKREPAMWWPWGFSQWKPVHEASVRYVCKYVLKEHLSDRDEDAQGHLCMSKKPPLGALYFQRRAEEYVRAGLAPQSLEYRMDEARTSKGEPLQFMLSGRSAELFLEHYVRAWREHRPGRPLPASPLVEGWLEYGVVRVPDPEEVGWAVFQDWDRRQRGKVRVDPSREVPKLGRVPRASANIRPLLGEVERQLAEVERVGRIARYTREFEDQLAERNEDGQRREEERQTKEREAERFADRLNGPFGGRRYE